MTEQDPAAWTKDSCWLCSPDRSDLCHLHERVRDAEPLPGSLAWVVPVEPEAPADA